MTAVVTPAAARLHLRVGAEATDEALTPLIAAAQGRIEDFLERPLVGDGGWETEGDVPPMVVHAVKLALSDLYDNRETPTLTDDWLRVAIGKHMSVSFG